ncbi:MAG: precorrin-3B C(17)-methyltransferase, partial [Actinomycetota bacterium]|nr:precorrin-3B C(17)-methyltransferase [Actinomycetota bacterium]
LVLCMATGAAVRLIAPHLTDKGTDPPVATVDDAGRFVVALSGGHRGGNDLAGRVADALGATAVITTASEAVGVPALDTLGTQLGLSVDPDHADLAAVGAALVAGQRVHRWRSRPWPTGPLPDNVVDVDRPAAPGLCVTDLVVELPRPGVVYRPASLVVGVGASRGVSAEELGNLVDSALSEAGLSARSVAYIATVDAKAEEDGLVRLAAARSWPVTTHPARALATVTVPNPSRVVRDAVGTPSVAEAAALLAGGELLVAKRKSPHATVAVARLPVRGRLALVGVGPGDEALVPPMARQALSAAEVVYGLDQYLERVRGWLRPGCRVEPSALGDEVKRAQSAVAAAQAGRSAALVSGGDVGVYAMASPALERADGDVDVVVVPGVTAAVAAAALLGSPLGHDHCAISLSDLLTDWAVIRRRVQTAAEGDFVVCFYNPRSGDREWQLGKACALLSEHRKAGTPVGIVTDAYRPTQRVVLTTLGELDCDLVGMRTIVVVGSSQTRIVAGRMVTPRGYPRDATGAGGRLAARAVGTAGRAGEQGRR